jgi:TetR/AcrR family transcriptional regulator, cholesterol catabolism regulator
MVTDISPRQEAILREAAALFRTKGYAATSMRDLAAAVGMEAASLYNHIKSKQELLRIICTTVAQRYVDGLHQIDGLAVSPVEKIEKLIHLQVDVITADPQMAAVAQDEWRHLDDVTRRAFVHQRNEYEATLRGWITDAMQAGQVRALDANLVLFTLLSALQWLHHWFRPERALHADEIKHQLTTMLLRGLKL